MKRKPTILLDVDGVMADFVGQVIDIINRQFPQRTLYREEIDCWDIEQCIDVDVADPYGYAISVMSRPGFVISMRPIMGAVSGVRSLKEIADVYALSSSMTLNPEWDRERRIWLQTIMALDRKKVVLTHAKHLVRGDMFVDDRAENIVAWKRAFPDGLALLWTAPYNRDAMTHDDGSEIEHVSSWEDVVRHAETLIDR